MSTTSRHSVIYELLSEIRNLRDTELYIQHHILTKQKVVYALMEGINQQESKSISVDEVHKELKATDESSYIKS